MTITRLDREGRDDRRQLIKTGGIREPATGLSSRLVERTKIYIYILNDMTKYKHFFQSSHV